MAIKNQPKQSSTVGYTVINDTNAMPCKLRLLKLKPHVSLGLRLLFLLRAKSERHVVGKKQLMSCVNLMRPCDLDICRQTNLS